MVAKRTVFFRETRRRAPARVQTITVIALSEAVRLLRRRASLQRGFTLVEALVVVTILGFLSAVSVSLITIIFDANLRTTQLMNQQTTVENTFGFLASRLATTQYDQIGLSDNNGKVDPLSVAGDQLVFSSGAVGGATCYRLLYIEDLEEIRVASASSCSPIKPVRGPNQQSAAGRPYAFPGESDFDPAIDMAYPQVVQYCADNPQYAEQCNDTAAQSWLLASAVRNNDFTEEELATLPEGLQSSLASKSQEDRYLAPFYYLDRSGNPWSEGTHASEDGPDPHAVKNSTSTFYNSIASLATNIGGVRVRGFVDALPLDVGGTEKIIGRYYQQNFTFQQVCDTGYASGNQAGGDLSGTFPTLYLNDNVVDYNKTVRFPSEEVKRTSSVGLDSGSWNTISFDGSAGNNVEAEIGGRYLVVGAVTGYDASGGNPVRALQLLKNNSTIGGNSGPAFPLQASAVVDLNAGDQITLQLRSTDGSAPANSGSPISLSIYWISKK